MNLYDWFHGNFNNYSFSLQPKKMGNAFTTTAAFFTKSETLTLPSGQKVNFNTSQNQLDLSYKRLNKEVILHLSHFQFPNLRVLDLSLNNLGDQGLRSLKRINMENLTILKLFKNNITDYGVNHLVECNMTKISDLNLQWNELQDCAGLKNLCKNNWKTIATIQLKYNYIGKIGAIQIFIYPMNESSEIRMSLCWNPLKDQGRRMKKRLQRIEKLVKVETNWMR